MDNFDVLTVQAMSPPVDTPQEFIQPAGAVVAESSLFWFLGWFNRTSETGHDDSSDGESRVSTPSLATTYPIHPPQPENRVSCLICMDDHAEPDTLSIVNCGHAYCRECLSTYVSGKLKESRYPIHCPACVTENGSDVHVTEDVFELLDMSEEDVDRLIEAQLRTYAISLSCTRCKRTMRVDREEYLAQDLITCPLPPCGHRWCKFCQKEVPCNTIHRCKNWRLDGLTWRKGWKSCPGCGVLVERISGCNHIMCAAPGCSVHFCYRCGGLIIDPSKGGHVGTAIINHYSRCRQHRRRIPRRIRQACIIQ